MATLELDDLPPRIAAQLAAMAPGETLILTRGGAVVGRLSAEAPVAPVVKVETLSAEGGMREIMEHFEAMIEDQF
jgi:hypothetical protein